MKWVTPASAGDSSRDPAPIQNPTAAERTWSSGSEITRSPESSSVSVQFCTVRILGIGREQRPDDRVLPLAVQPDRLALEAFAVEPRASRELLRGLVVRVRAQLDPAHPFLE